MRLLKTRSVRAYRAGVVRAALVRASWAMVPGPRRLRTALLAAPLLLAHPERLPDRDAVPPALAATAPETAMPRITASTLPGGPAHVYASRAPGAGGGLSALPAVSSVEDAWSVAFFGDRERMTAYIERTAVAHDLPAEFLLRLLKQESGLNHQAVSRAGALGVAQFMPATAGERGLVNPFDPFEAIPKSAELLREYRTRFGSLGLAAAAYNAGPRRVRDWLEGRGPLPAETRDYVMRITGRTAEDWRSGGDAYAFAVPPFGR